MVAPIDELWQRYKSGVSPQNKEARDSILQYYTQKWVIPLAKKRMKDQYSIYGVTLDQLIQQGRLAIFDRMQKFDINTGNSFATFIKKRITGSFQDVFRKEGALPRSFEMYLQQYNEAVEKASQNDYFSSEELRKMTGLSKKKFKKAENLAAFPLYVSYDSPINYSGGLNKRIEFESKSQGPEDKAISADIKDYLFRGLNKQERLVIYGHYYEGLTMSEIGHILGVSNSRAAQINRNILKKLRERLLSEREVA